MELVLPNNYVALEQEECLYLDGGLGVEAVIAIITATIEAGRVSYSAGQAVGRNLYYKGLTKSQYTKFKSSYRGAILLGSIGTPFILGLENALYSKWR